jgi:hypothetical protein
MKPVPQPTPDIKGLLDYARRTREALDSLPRWLDGVELVGTVESPGIALSAGVGLAIPHGLGRAWRGWWLTLVYSGSGAAMVNSDQDGLFHDRTTHLYLYSASACRVNVWVF